MLLSSIVAIICNCYLYCCVKTVLISYIGYAYATGWELNNLAYKLCSKLHLPTCFEGKSQFQASLLKYFGNLCFRKWGSVNMKVQVLVCFWQKPSRCVYYISYNAIYSVYIQLYISIVKFIYTLRSHYGNMFRP